MDKNQIINDLKRHLKFKTDTEFANFLGIKPNVLANWRNRNTFDTDLILTKCDDINHKWLLTGEGQMLKSESSINPNKTAMESKTLIDELKDRISSLEKQLNEKQQFCTFLMKQNDELQQLVTGIPEIKKKEAV